jgi:diguanylate cyclase (GGDEF)-like protein/PAS domain S-box-containing protein
MKITLRPGLWLLLLVVFLAGTAVSVSMWYFLRGQESRRAQGLLSKASASLQDRVQAELDQEVAALERLAGKWKVRPDLRREEWEYDVRQMLESRPSLLSVAWLDEPGPGRDWPIAWALPSVYQSATVSLHNLLQDHRPEVLAGVRQEKQTRISDAILVADRGKAFAVYVPAVTNGKMRGALLGVFHLQLLLDAIFERLLAADYSLQLMDGYESIYQRGAAKNHPTDWEHQGSLNVFSSKWKLRVWPNPDVQRSNEKLADLLLLCGMGVSVLLTGLVWFAARQPVGRAKLTPLPETPEGQRRNEDRRRLWEAVLGALDEPFFVAESEKVMGAGPVIVFANEALTRLTGYEVADLVGKSPRMLFAPELLQKSAHGEAVRIVLNPRSGESAEVNLQVKPLGGPPERPSHWVVALQREAAPKAAAAMTVDALVAAAPMPAQLLDGEGKVLAWNSLAEAATGYSAGELLGHPSPVPVELPNTGYWAKEDLRAAHRHAGRLELTCWTAPLEGEPQRFLCLFADFTRDRLAAAQTAERETAFLALLNRSSEVLALLDDSANIQYLNEQVRQLLGLSPEELVGAPVTELLDEVPATTETAPLLLKQKDGGIRVFEGSLQPVAGTHYLALAAQLPAPPALADAMADVVVTYDTEQRVTWMNRAAEELYGLRLDAVRGLTLGQAQPEWLQAPARQEIFAEFDRTGNWRGEISLLTPAGREIVQDVALTPLRNAQGEVIGAVAVHRDITARKSAREALELDEQSRTLAALGAAEGLWDWNLETGEVYYSPTWKSMLGYRDEEIAGEVEEWHMLLHPDDLPLVKSRTAAYLEGEAGPLELEYRARAASGEYRWMQARAVAVRNEHGKAQRLVGLQADIHADKERDEALLFEAFHDHLTGLPNRALFLDRLSGELANGLPLLVGFLDLTQFSAVNEKLGTRGADQVLAEVGVRVAGVLPPEGFLARYGSDEFVLLLPKLSAEECEALAGLIRSRLQAPFEHQGRQVTLDCRLGFAFAQAGEREPEALIQRASQAAIEQQNKPNSLALEQFRVYYHPIISLESGEITGMEALVRWQHPGRGLLTPDQFLPAAEASGDILAIDYWVIREAAAKLRELDEKFPGAQPLGLTVNLASRHFTSEAALQELEREIAAAGLERERLRIEIYDLPGELPSAVEAQLRRLGVAVNLPGLSSEALPDVARMRQGRIKLPPALVRGLATGRNVEKVRAIINLARRENLQVVAEGVETLEQLAVLRELKCHLAQGYYFSQPASLADTERLLARGPRW